MKKQPPIAKDGYPRYWPQPAGAITYKLNGAHVGRGNILNIAGAGITATPLPDGITYNISGGGGGGGITGAQNIGLSGSGLFAGISGGNTLDFKNLVAGAGISLVVAADAITISGTGIGGTIAATEVGYGSGVNTLTSNSTFTYLPGVGLGQLNIGGALIWLQPEGGNPSSLWVGESAGQVASTSLLGRNTGVGYLTGSSMTTGSDNTFIGQAAGVANTTADNNTFVGSSAGRFTTTGYTNTFIGQAAGYTNDIGIGNTFIGNIAGQANTSGNSNIYIGGKSGNGMTTGSYNFFLGDETSATNSAFNDIIIIGHLGIAEQANQMIVGSNSGHFISDVVIGSGVSDTTPQGLTFHTSNGAGTNIAGGFIRMQPGLGTGSAAGATFFVASSLPGASGTTLRTAHDYFSVNATVQQLGDISGSLNNTLFTLDGSTANQFAVLSAANLIQFNSDRIHLNGGQRASYTYAGVDAAFAVQTSTYAVGMNPATVGVTATLPATPFAGDMHWVGDALGNCIVTTNEITVDGNGHNIKGNPTDSIINAYQWKCYTYDGTNAVWQVFSAS